MMQGDRTTRAVHQSRSAAVVAVVAGTIAGEKEGGMKHWSDDHLRLAQAAVQVRDRLRSLLPRLPESERRAVGEALVILGQALKARVRRGKREATA